jgi:hypothetical protein
MAWFLTEDPDEHLATAGGFLTSDVAANTILLVAADRLRAQDGSSSHALYQRLGYRPVADRVEWSFSPRGPR